MKYFSYIDNTYTLKNKLHKAVYNFLEEQNRQEIEAECVEEFKDYIETEIKRLNEMHARCQPVQVTWQEKGKDNYNSFRRHYPDFSLRLNWTGSICCFYLFAGKEVQP